MELARAAEAEYAAELARAAEAKRTKKLARAEAKRAAEAARAAEAERAAELARAAEAKRAADADRTVELSHAALVERATEVARDAELARKAAEPAKPKPVFGTRHRIRGPARQQASSKMTDLSDHFRWSGDLRLADVLESVRAGESASSSWRRRAIVLVMAAMLLITAASVAFALFRSSGTERSGAGLLDSDVATRTSAAAWLARQVAPGAIVACDPVMCSALKAQRFPEHDLRVLEPTLPYPLSTAVVIATARVSDQFGSSLSSAYAPEILASFGTGTARIAIRVTAPHGAASYLAALKADMHDRMLDRASLLNIKQIRLSATARAQLAAGKVDARLVFTIAHLAQEHQVNVRDFGNSAPGASPGLPLRMVDITETAGAESVSPAYLRWVTLVLQEQSPPFRPLRLQGIRLAGGQEILRIVFAAPSQLGLRPSDVP